MAADAELDITMKIDAAKHAQEQWKHSTFQERKKVVRTLKSWLVKEKELCARVTCRDTGKTSKAFACAVKLLTLISLLAVIDAALGEILTTCAKMDWLLKHGEKALQPSKRSTSFMLMYKSSKVYYEPLGVVAAIVS